MLQTTDSEIDSADVLKMGAADLRRTIREGRGGSKGEVQMDIWSIDGCNKTHNTSFCCIESDSDGISACVRFLSFLLRCVGGERKEMSIRKLWKTVTWDV